MRGAAVWFVTLLDRGPRTEDRGAYAHVCRAGRDRGLEVGAHPGREPGGVGPSRPRSRRGSRPAARTPRPGLRRGAPPPSARAAGACPAPPPAAASASSSAGSAPLRPLGRPGGSRLTWSRQSTGCDRSCAPRWRPATSLARSTDSTTSAYDATAAALLLCSPPMKCQRSPRSAHSAALACGLLVPVLPDVGDPEVGQDPHVRGREELRDHDQGHLAGSRPASAQAALDAPPDRSPGRRRSPRPGRS